MTAQHWDKVFEEGADFTPLNEVFLDALLQKVDSTLNHKGAKVIDLGCGAGDTLVKFAKKDFQVIGIDFSEAALKKARERLKSEDITNFQLVNQNLDSLDTLDASDIIFSKLTFAFLKDKNKFTQAVSSSIKRSGAFILMTPVLHKNIQYQAEDKPSIAVDYEEAKFLLTRYFNSVEEFHHNYFGTKGDLITFIARN